MQRNVYSAENSERILKPRQRTINFLAQRKSRSNGQQKHKEGHFLGVLEHREIGTVFIAM